MRSIKNICLSCCCCFVIVVSAAQTPSDTTEIDFESIMETLVQESESNINYNTVLEQLRYYHKNPLNLNNASAEQLSDLFILSELQIKSLLQHRKKVGKLVSIYELQAVEHFDQQTINLLLPFVSLKKEVVDYHAPLKERITKGEHQLFVRSKRILEEQKGYTPPDTINGEPTSRYQGSPYKLYTRYNYRYDWQLRWGVTAEKDAGEEFFQGSQKRGFDYYSGHLYFKTNSILKDVAIGDYELKFGQGLAVYSGFSFGKTPYVMNINRAGREIRPYTSVNETNFFRGVATRWGYKNFKLTTFASHKKVDANVTEIDSANQSAEAISTIQQAGYHRTESELSDRKAITQSIYGGHLTYESNHVDLGATVSYTDLSAALTNSRNALYNKYEFQGDQLLNGSIDYSVIYRNINFFGEAAMSDNGALALVNGALLSLAPTVDVGVLHRKLDRDYHSLYNSAFAEYGKGVNENGLYLSLKLTPTEPLELSGYFDTYKHPWLRYQIDAPSYGYDYIVQGRYELPGGAEMYVRWKQEQKQENLSDNPLPMSQLTMTNLSRFRFHIEYQLFDEVMTFRNRVELSRYQEGKQEAEHGYMIYQDIIFKKYEVFPVSLTGRLAYFDTKSYNTAIWAYENNVLYAFSIPAYFYRGMRTYLLARYKVSQHIDLWVRFARTYYTNREQISSGLNQIDGNTKTDINGQLRIKF